MNNYQVNICFEEKADNVENMGAIFSVLHADSKMDAEALAAKLRASVGDKLVRAPGGETMASFEAQVERLNGLLHDVMEACDKPTSVGQLREKILSVVAQARGH